MLWKSITGSSGKLIKNEKLTEAINYAVQIDIEGTIAFIPEDDIHLDYLKEHLNDHLASG